MYIKHTRSIHEYAMTESWLVKAEQCDHSNLFSCIISKEVKMNDKNVNILATTFGIHSRFEIKLGYLLSYYYYIWPRGAIGGKTGKTAVLPWFCNIEHGSGSSGAPAFYGGLSLSGLVRIRARIARAEIFWSFWIKFFFEIWKLGVLHQTNVLVFSIPCYLVKRRSIYSAIDSSGAGGARAPPEFGGSEKGRSLISAYRS